MPQKHYGFKDYYRLLNIPFGATDTEIKQAYRVCAMEFHPDKHPENPEQYHHVFIAVQEAYHTLSDPALKEVYDRQYMAAAGGYQEDVSGNYQACTVPAYEETWWGRNGWWAYLLIVFLIHAIRGDS